MSPNGVNDEDHDDDHLNPDKAKQGVLSEINAEIPIGDKDFVYYTIITIFVVSIIASTVCSGAFLVIISLFWKNFNNMPFYRLLTQLTIFVFILSLLHLVVSIPATLFSLITTDYARSDLYVVFSYIIDFCQYSILFANIVIALQRFTVFMIPKPFSEKVFKSPFLYIWQGIILVLPLVAIFLMYFNKCQYQYKSDVMHYALYCEPKSKLVVYTPNPSVIQFLELLIQIGFPLFNFFLYVIIIIKIFLMRKGKLNQHEISILKQAMAVFILFQASSTMFLLCQTLQFGIKSAFLVKRVINTKTMIRVLLTSTPLECCDKSSELGVDRQNDYPGSDNVSKTDSRTPTTRSDGHSCVRLNCLLAPPHRASFSYVLVKFEKSYDRKSRVKPRLTAQLEQNQPYDQTQRNDKNLGCDVNCEYVIVKM